MGSMQARREQRQLLGLVGLVLIFAAVLIFGALVAGGKAGSPAYDIEAGYQLTPAPGPYVSARVNLSLGELGPVDLWLLPEGGVVLGDPAEWYGRVQVLADTPICTVGGEARAGEADHALVTRVFVRFGL